MGRYAKEVTKLHDAIRHFFPGAIEKPIENVACIKVAIDIMQKAKDVLDQEVQIRAAFVDKARIEWLEDQLGKNGVIIKRRFLGKGFKVVPGKKKPGTPKDVRHAIDSLMNSFIKKTGADNDQPKSKS